MNLTDCQKVFFYIFESVCSNKPVILSKIRGEFYYFVNDICFCALIFIYEIHVSRIFHLVAIKLKCVSNYK